MYVVVFQLMHRGLAVSQALCVDLETWSIAQGHS